MRSSAFIAALALSAAPLGAQLAAAPEPPPVLPAAAPVAVTAELAAPANAAPVLDAAVGARPVAMRAELRPAEQRAAAVQPPRRRGYGRDVALMAVGGAAILLGALAGGDTGGLLIVGGAVVGGIGLYQFLQ